MNQIARVAALAALVLGLVPAAATAQSGNSVKGRIRTASGSSAPSIIVNVESATGTLVGQTTTNNEGDFYFGGLAGGSYFVLVNEPGYEPVRERVEFLVDPGEERPGENQFLHVTLTPKAGAAPLPVRGSVFVQDVPPAARAAYDRGAKASRESKPAEAVAGYREAIAAFDKYFDAHFALATELLKSNDLAGATAELDAANKINGKDARVYATFGSLLARQKKFAVAAATFGEAARLSPTDPQYPLMRATVLIDQATITDASKPEGAKTRSDLLAAAGSDLDHAFELSGRTLATVHLQRARLYERMGDKNAAADALEAYLKAVPNASNAAAIRDSVAKLRAK